MDGMDISQTTRNARAPGGAKNVLAVKEIKKNSDRNTERNLK